MIRRQSPHIAMGKDGEGDGEKTDQTGAGGRNSSSHEKPDGQLFDTTEDRRRRRLEDSDRYAFLMNECAALASCWNRSSSILVYVWGWQHSGRFSNTFL